MRLEGLLLMLMISVSAFSQQNAEISDFDPFIDLVDIILDEEEPDTIIQEIPPSLSDLIGQCYADATVSDEVATDVLGYVVDVYSVHGYHESGCWDPGSGFIRYRPFKGELPSFDIVQDFRVPVEGCLTSGYGYRQSFRRYHRGIDISLAEGDTVRAALPGVVVKTGFEPKGFGRYVVVAHAGNMETVYAHLKSSIVAPGQKLHEGDALGIGGSTGNATGPHLHFETRHFGVPVDPLSNSVLRLKFSSRNLSISRR